MLFVVVVVVPETTESFPASSSTNVADGSGAPPFVSRRSSSPESPAARNRAL